MGGTSTDVSHYAGEFERVFEHPGGRRAGARADDEHPHRRGRAAGRSCTSTARATASGPDSAGADPGPGLLPAWRPADRHRRQRDARHDPAARTSRTSSAHAATSRWTPRRGARAVRRARRRDRHARPGRPRARGGGRGLPARSPWRTWPTRSRRSRCSAATTSPRYALTTFGGAGGQHACAVADALGIETVLIHPLAGVLSAYGMGLADLTAMREQRGGAAADRGALPAARASGSTRSAAAARAELRDTAWPHGRVDRDPPGPPALRGHRYRARRCRSATADAMRAAFEAAYRQPLLLPDADKPLVVEAVSVEATGARRCAAGAAYARSASREASRRPAATGADVRRRPVARDARLFAREDAAPRRRRRRARRSSPRPTPPRWSTPGWQAAVTALRPSAAAPGAAAPRRVAVGTEVDPVMLEIFNNLFMSIAEQMGAAAAEHRPLGQHQGAARLLLRPVRRRRQPDRQRAAHAGAPGLDGREHQDGDRARTRARMQPGDVYALNDPYHGGTHLPDVTVITPVFDDARAASRCSTSPRAATTPTSAASPRLDAAVQPTRIEEEGVLFDNLLLVDGRAAARGRDARRC